MNVCFLVAALILSFCSGSHAADPVLRIGVDAPYPPFAYTDPATGKLTGFDYDIAEAVCRKIGRQCDIQVVPFDEIIPRIVEGKLDIGVAGMARKPEREKLVLFSEKYFRSSSIFIEIPGSNVVGREGLKGKKIGVQNKTTQEDYLRETYGDVAEVVTFTGFEDIMKALIARQLDIAFIDGLPGYHYLKSEAGQGLDIAGEPVKLGSASCIVLHPSLVKERDAINQAILDLRSSGEYDTINRKYFEFNIY
ncbi:MAG: transporter substrate-binding domain-containing protein [Syntrophobacteraceae bacterium]|jgi:ABC-type amino acid transport substrate-binding protein|nr:transporter substrate-binding domain-containing protein [Syntrophobacteraceae bacterium]